LRRYCLELVIATILLVGLVGCINWIVDPFDVYRMVREEGFNEYKSQYGKYARLAKIVQIEKNPRRNLALGNSRTQMGVDMSHPLWEGYSGWNLAVNGANIYLIRRFLEHAAAVSPLEKVVIGIDFGMFNGQNIRELNDESYFAVDKNGDRNRLHRFKQYVLTLGTYSALLASIETLRKQRPIDNVYALDGRRFTSQARMKVLEDGGHDKEFSALERRSVELYWDPCLKKIVYGYDTALGQTTMDEFRKIIDLVVRRKIKMYLVISPCHARLFDAEYNMGLGAKVEQWKRDITSIVDQANMRNVDMPVELWDFSGYSAYSTEAVPPAADHKSLMQWYVDPSHYSVELGHIMLSRIMGNETSSPFGRRLTASSLDRVLQQHHLAREEYYRREPVLSRMLRDRVLNTLETLKEQNSRCGKTKLLNQDGE
jgi:hypothetical protein